MRLGASPPSWQPLPASAALSPGPPKPLALHTATAAPMPRASDGARVQSVVVAGGMDGAYAASAAVYRLQYTAQGAYEWAT